MRDRVGGRWSWARPRRPIVSAALALAALDAVPRLRVRGALLMLGHQLTYAHHLARAAAEALHMTAGPWRAALVAWAEALDLTVSLAVKDAGTGEATRAALALEAALHRARADIRRCLESGTPRCGRRMARALAGELSRACALLEQACHDFRGADLSTLELDHLYLGGVRWDAATRWPAPAAARIRAASTPTADGGFQVQDQW